MVEGSGMGSRVGFAEGSGVGSFVVGGGLGGGVGFNVGAGVGSGVGNCVGGGVSFHVLPFDGHDVGLAVVGLDVVGLAEGWALGLEVGSPVVGGGVGLCVMGGLSHHPTNSQAFVCIGS